MLHNDFKIMFFLILFGLFGLWVIVSFPGMGYEAGTDLSLFSKSCYKIAEIIHFSLNFWQRFLPDFIAFSASFLTSTFLLTFSISMLIKCTKWLKRQE